MRLMRHTNQVVKELLRKAASQGDVPPPPEKKSPLSVAAGTIA